MKFLSKLFSKKSKLNNKVNVPNNNDIMVTSIDDTLMNIHPDIKNLIWFEDGPKKNYIHHENHYEYNVGIFKIIIQSSNSKEPSLVSTKLPIKLDIDSSKVIPPEYYPNYYELTEEQRGIYWKFLSDPYNNSFNISYVFLLYYGLERHLFEGNYRDAFEVILKLRDIYDNASFQSYSASSIITTCLIKKDLEMAIKFYNSLDKDYKFIFSDDLYIFFKFGLNQPLTPKDIMRMSKSFEFSNQNYIKKYPEMFVEELTNVIKDTLKCDVIKINEYITSSQWKKLNKQDIIMFANMSISDRKIEIPLIKESFEFKKIIYDLLNNTHKNLKEKLSKMRKNGDYPIPKSTQSKKQLILCFDEKMEQNLLLEYNSCSNAINKHFALIKLQDFYYKYRNLDEKYLNKCIDYCKEDLSHLKELQEEYINEEKIHLKYFNSKNDDYKIKPFNGDIPAFRRLVIIYEKQKNYEDAINVCKDAVAYYNQIDMFESVYEYTNRIQKIESKVAKTKKS